MTSEDRISQSTYFGASWKTIDSLSVVFVKNEIKCLAVIFFHCFTNICQIRKIRDTIDGSD